MCEIGNLSDFVAKVWILRMIVFVEFAVLQEYCFSGCGECGVE